MKQKKQYTDRSDYWNTPSNIYNYVLEKGYIDYNVSGSMITPFNKDVSKYHNKKIYINPPFSIINKDEFIETIFGLRQNNNDIILLIPARTDTKMFHTLLELNPIINFIKGRLNFNDSKQAAPFPTLLLEFKNTISSKRYESVSKDDFI